MIARRGEVLTAAGQQCLPAYLDLRAFAPEASALPPELRERDEIIPLRLAGQAAPVWRVCFPDHHLTEHGEFDAADPMFWSFRQLPLTSPRNGLVRLGKLTDLDPNETDWSAGCHRVALFELPDPLVSGPGSSAIEPSSRLPLSDVGVSEAD